MNSLTELVAQKWPLFFPKDLHCHIVHCQRYILLRRSLSHRIRRSWRKPQRASPRAFPVSLAHIFMGQRPNENLEERHICSIRCVLKFLLHLPKGSITSSRLESFYFPAITRPIHFSRYTAKRISIVRITLYNIAYLSKFYFHVSITQS